MVRTARSFGHEPCSFLKFNFAPLSHVLLCVDVTVERKLMFKSGQGSWPKYLTIFVFFIIRLVRSCLAHLIVSMQWNILCRMANGHNKACGVTMSTLYVIKHYVKTGSFISKPDSLEHDLLPYWKGEKTFLGELDC